TTRTWSTRSAGAATRVTDSRRCSAGTCSACCGADCLTRSGENGPVAAVYRLEELGWFQFERLCEELAELELGVSNPARPRPVARAPARPRRCPLPPAAPPAAAVRRARTTRR